MLNQFRKSFKTFVRIFRKDRSLAFKLLQARLETHLGFSIFFIDPARIMTRSFELRHTQKISSDLTPVGNYYIVEKLLPHNPTIISLGIGEDTRFDEDVVEKYNANLFMFDPTPRSASHVCSRKKLKNAKFEQFAVSDFDGNLEVYIDDLEDDLNTTSSVSIFQPKNPETSYFVPCKSISTIIKENQLKDIDVLKIDIEGGGLLVLKQLFSRNIFPVQICGEFERPVRKQEAKQFFSEMIEVINTLNDRGYRIYRTRNADIGFQIEFTAACYMQTDN